MFSLSLYGFTIINFFALGEPIPVKVIGGWIWAVFAIFSRLSGPEGYQVLC